MEWQLVPLQCLLLVLIIFSRIDIAWNLPYCCLFALCAFQFNLCFILVLSYFCMNIFKICFKSAWIFCVFWVDLLNYRLPKICMNVLACVICAINVGIYFLYWFLDMYLYCMTCFIVLYLCNFIMHVGLKSSWELMWCC